MNIKKAQIGIWGRICLLVRFALNEHKYSKIMSKRRFKSLPRFLNGFYIDLST
jgi:hypothetical protein